VVTDKTEDGKSIGFEICIVYADYKEPFAQVVQLAEQRLPGAKLCDGDSLFGDITFYFTPGGKKWRSCGSTATRTY
jgi:hypothetical protein